MIPQAPPQPVSENSEYLLQLIPETDAAKFVGYTIRALQNWRVRGGGPKYVKVSSRSIRYRRKDLIDWADSRVVASSNQSAAG
jgi:predicted DNA-binding transcriptional regulator AlpA